MTPAFCGFPVPGTRRGGRLALSSGQRHRRPHNLQRVRETPSYRSRPPPSASLDGPPSPTPPSPSSPRDKEPLLTCSLVGVGESALFLAPVDPVLSVQHRAVPIPLPSPKRDVDLCLSAVRRDPAPSTSPFSKWQIGSTLFSTRAFYDPLFADFQEHNGANPAARQVKTSALAGAWSAQAHTEVDVLDAVLQGLNDAGACVVRCEVRESPSLELDSVSLRLVYVYRTRVARWTDFEPTSETRESGTAFAPGEHEVGVPPEMLAVAIAAAARHRVPIAVPEWVYRQTAVHTHAHLDRPGLVDVERPRPVEPRAARVQESRVGRPPGEVKFEELEGMSTRELRACLRLAGVPSLSRASWEELVEEMAPYMDEIERRKMALADAVGVENFGAAATLARSKSRRHVVMESLDEAVRQERFLDAARLKKELHLLTEKRADPTQDEGAYDPYLDQDDWYRPG